MARCKAILKSGDQCRNNAIRGTNYCYISSHGRVRKAFRQRARNFARNKWLEITALVIALILGLAPIWLWFHDKRVSTAAGYISSPSEPTPLSISVGSVEFQIFSAGGVVFDDGKEPLLSIRVHDGRLLVSTRIRDESGALLAEMKDNEWKLASQPAIFDRNYTADVLEVRDRNGRVVLQVANVGRTIDLAAVFHCENGWSYLVGPLPGGSGMELRPPGHPLTNGIPAICDYPSDIHLGQCPGIDRLRERLSEVHTSYKLYFPIHLCVQPTKS